VSTDEFFVLLLSAAFGGLSAFGWYARISARSLARGVERWRNALGLAPVVSLVGVFVALKIAAAHDVRDAPQYLLLYVALGAAWIFAAAGVLAVFGISFRDDAIERRNPAAAVAVMCAMTAHAAIYAGANIGDGPGWWCVVAAGLLGGGGWFLLWWGVETGCAASEHITVERDLPTAIRLGGYMLASGIVCARGVAGDWVSLGETIRDFWVAWPAAALAAIAVGAERALRDRPAGQDIRIAALIALAYVAGGATAVLTSPPLSENPLYGAAP
jgi:hypothetical protein